MKRVTKLALYGKSRQDDNLADILNLMAEARSMGFGLLCHVKFAAYLMRLGVDKSLIPPTFTDRPDAEAAISIGGDGTFLRTARRLGECGIPIAGVNTGNLGYLAHFKLEDAKELLTALSEGTLKVEWRRMLRVSGPDIPEDFICDALNEIAILKDDTSSMINTHVEIDGYFLSDYSADGLIASTATGSTAYNLSVGGPILQPGLDSMVLSPVAPHMLTLRPIVVSRKSVLRLTTESRSPSYRLSVDGYSCALPAGSTLEVTGSPVCVQLLTRPGETFASTLREKLLLGRH